MNRAANSNSSAIFAFYETVRRWMQTFVELVYSFIDLFHCMFTMVHTHVHVDDLLVFLLQLHIMKRIAPSPFARRCGALVDVDSCRFIGPRPRPLAGRLGGICPGQGPQRLLVLFCLKSSMYVLLVMFLSMSNRCMFALKNMEAKLVLFFNFATLGL